LLKKQTYLATSGFEVVESPSLYYFR